MSSTSSIARLHSPRSNINNLPPPRPLATLAPLRFNLFSSNRQSEILQSQRDSAPKPRVSRMQRGLPWEPSPPHPPNRNAVPNFAKAKIGKPRIERIERIFISFLLTAPTPSSFQSQNVDLPNPKGIPHPSPGLAECKEAYPGNVAPHIPRTATRFRITTAGTRGPANARRSRG